MKELIPMIFDNQNSIQQEDDIDYEPVLTEFENGLEHNSLRIKNLVQEDRLLSSGLHPLDAMNSIQDYGIIDDVELSFISEFGAIQIGRTIKLYQNGGLIIKTENAGIANQIIDEGSSAALTLDNVMDVEAIYGGTVQTSPDCTADFAQFGGTTENSTGFLATFIWDQAMETDGLSDINLTWSWGDGTPSTTTSDGTSSHTFAEEGTYNVCLQVSWEYDDDNNPVSCMAGPTCQEITISDGNPCTEDILCGAAAALGLFPTLSSVVISDNNSTSGMLCANIEGVVGFLANFCADIEQEDVTLTFNGMEGPCWETCDGPRDLVLSLGNACETTLTIEFNEDGGCQGGDYDTNWGWISIDDETGLSIRQQTKSASNGGNNKCLAKMIRKEKNDRDKWKRKRDYLAIEMDKLCWGNQTCNCDQDLNVNESEYPGNRKYSLTAKENDFSSGIDGLNLRFDDDECWRASYREGSSSSNRALRGTGTGCDNY